MRLIELDASKMQHPAAAHEYLQEKFHFPAYYGHNLDALYDCLLEITEETRVHVTGYNADKDYARKILQVFQNAAGENEAFSLR